MVFARMVGKISGLRLMKKAESPDDEFAHVTSEIVAWKASVNR